MTAFFMLRNAPPIATRPALSHNVRTMSDDQEKPEAAKEQAPAKTTSDALAKGVSKSLWMGTAVGIGSAAIVAALLYARKRS